MAAVDCYKSIGSWQNEDKDGMAVGFNIDRLRFSCCCHIWRPVSITRHVVLQGNLTYSETDFVIRYRRRQRAMLASKTMKQRLILSGM